MQANTPWEMLPSRQRTRSAPRNSTRFAAQYSARGLPCERFTAVLTDRTSCITRGRGGWLDLPRGGLAPPILCQLSWRALHRVTVPLKTRIAFDDPEPMCCAALLGLGVTLIAVPHAFPHLESGTLVRMVPQWYADAGPISIYYASRTLVPAKTRVFVDFIVDVFRRKRLAERFAGSIG
jgi:DNA-binding transcriptional LysR family regulator